MSKLVLILLYFTILLSCSTITQNPDPIPNHDTFTIASKFVNENRVINIWTPKNYKDGNQNFPVLYMPDGGIKEDFPHIANTIAKLVKSNLIEPIILVGIENTDRRRDLSGYSEVKADEKYCPLDDGAKNFRAFITQELMQEINTKYRTTTKKGILGESLAGLFVVETCLLAPNSFDFYIAMDPSLWWNNHYLEQHANAYLSKFSNDKRKLWFAGSSAEDINKYTRGFANTLKTNAPNTLLWKYSDEPKEKHNTIFRSTKEKALIWTFGLK